MEASLGVFLISKVGGTAQSTCRMFVGNKWDRKPEAFTAVPDTSVIVNTVMIPEK